jgi:hypothetical protein
VTAIREALEAHQLLRNRGGDVGLVVDRQK